MKETHVFEANIWVGIDSACSILKESRHILSNLEDQAKIGR